MTKAQKIKPQVSSPEKSLEAACAEYSQGSRPLTVTDIAEQMRAPLKVIDAYGSSVDTAKFNSIYNSAWEERQALEQAIVNMRCVNTQEAAIIATVLISVVDDAMHCDDTVEYKDAQLEIIMRTLESILDGMKLSGITAPEEFGWYNGLLPLSMQKQEVTAA